MLNHVALKYAKMPPKKKRMTKKTKLLVKHRTAMVTELGDDDHADVVGAVVDKLSAGLHLQCCKSRKKFVAVFCGDHAKEALDSVLNL